jgi:recombinational DNA repair ATPase RecF
VLTVESITITEFRGIRSLTLDLRSKNFAICGPNGTGKSGVVDALEFGLTGTVSRLVGESRGEVSLKEHGPHVDHKDHPERAKVAVKVKLTATGQTATITRTVKAPSQAKIEPNEPTLVAAVKAAMANRDFTLSRRELIRYVLATPGKRSEEVQALLRLESVDKLRALFQRIANTADRELASAVTVKDTATSNLKEALGITENRREDILTAINPKRIALGLPPLADLTASTSLRDGLATPPPAQAQPVSKRQAAADLVSATEALAGLSAAALTQTIDGLRNDLQAIADSQSTATGTVQERFLSTGLSLILADECPFCTHAWNPDELRAHVRARITALERHAAKVRDLQRRMRPVTEILQRLSARMTTVARYGALLSPAISVTDLRTYAADCDASVREIEAVVPVAAALGRLGQVAIIPPSVLIVIEQLRTAVAALPDPDANTAARDFLIVATERLETWRVARRNETRLSGLAKTKRAMYEAYAAASDAVLTGLYEQVQSDFARLYRIVNNTDEAEFTATLTPSFGKLGFDVDFYGRGRFPPGAYHSEGHQDGMGLCLYLALMRHLHGDHFRLAVFDDVLMSVDVGHRRQVCTLLKSEFPNTQFILTTHDQVWLRHMRNEKLITGRAGLVIKKWSVDAGPQVWDDRDAWTEIEQTRASGDVRAAAALLRNYLEYTATELCYRLHASVALKPNGDYSLGELMPAAAAQLLKWYGTATDAANSWNLRDRVAVIAARKSEFSQAYTRTQVEQWPINSTIHYNEWANLSPAEFAPVCTAFEALLKACTCTSCGAYLSVLYTGETADSLTCDCGTSAFKLKRREQ